MIAAPCIGRCEQAPAAVVGQNPVAPAALRSRRGAVAAKQTRHEPERLTSTSPRYKAQGGYTLLRQCIGGELDVDDVIKTLEDSGLRGLGGAGFPAGRKWRIVRSEPAPRLMAVNIDEGEPGTFKDRVYLERDPHRFIEGMLIAAWAVGISNDLRLPARRVPRLPRAARVRAGEAARRAAVPPACRRSCCAAAPARTSAAKSRR